MNVLITGGTGFLGNNLYQWIRRNYPNVNVSVASRRTGTDIRNYEQVKEVIKNQDCVINCAAQTHVDYSLHNDLEDQLNFIDTNVKGTLHVIKACQRYNVKMIHISTSEVYGQNQTPGTPMKENHPIDPQAGIYAVTKAAADRLCRMETITTGADIVILRPFNFWGPGQSVEKFIPRLIQQGLNKEDLTIYGDGEQSRDYVYIEDVSKAIWLAKDLPTGTICNVATQITIKINTVAKIIADYYKVKIKHIEPRPGEVRQLLGDFRKINEMTGWLPSIHLDKTNLERVIKWYEINGFLRQPNL